MPNGPFDIIAALVHFTIGSNGTNGPQLRIFLSDSLIRATRLIRKRRNRDFRALHHLREVKSRIVFVPFGRAPEGLGNAPGEQESQEDEIEPVHVFNLRFVKTMKTGRACCWCELKRPQSFIISINTSDPGVGFLLRRQQISFRISRDNVPNK